MLLIVNDWILKPVYGNGFTGKLSDFAGLFAFGVFLCAVLPRRRRLVLGLVAVAFAVWKSDLSQPLIDGWNALGLFRVGRTVDFSDLFALAVLPLAGACVARPGRALFRPGWGVVVAGISLVAFAATQYRTVVPYETVYRFEVPIGVLASYVDSIGYPTYYFGARILGQAGPDSLEIRIPSDRCFDRVTARLLLEGDDARSAVRVLHIRHECPAERTDENVLSSILEDSVMARLRDHAGRQSGAPLSIRPDLADPGNTSEWILDGSGSWAVRDGMLVLYEPGIPDGPIRRPAALAILRTEPLRRATVRAEVQSTAPVGVSQRDLQVVVGYQSATRFYYVHLAGVTDAVHNGIFLVADADRRRIDSGTGLPQLTDEAWHDVRVEWDGNAGTIEVYVDGSAGPVLEARDATLKQGRVGFGSFDDTGEFREIRVAGTKVPAVSVP
ncbi:MAG: hypothetical protein KY466_13595 [Gemmatimonadetes bacterium]|nr:hypothetical protein [Gemmatimonadota bacterium]